MIAPTLILTRGDIAGLVDFADYVAAVEEGFGMLANGEVTAPAPLHVAADGGGLHAKAAGARIGGRHYVSVKVNANFPGNRARFDLPTIQGALLLYDGGNGALLAVMDSAEITIARTGAATALAARYLARPNSRILTLFGCGEQGRVQLAAIRHALPIDRVFVHDTDESRPAAFAKRVGGEFGLDVQAVADPREAARASDVIVTCTSSTEPLLDAADVAPGAFVAAVGADAPHKQELHPDLIARAKLVADVIDQCAMMGDLHHALAAGVVRREDVHAELGEIVVGAKPGRESPDDIFIFDSTGVGVQDVASAARVYSRAIDAGVGFACPLG